MEDIAIVAFVNGTNFLMNIHLMYFLITYLVTTIYMCISNDLPAVGEVLR